MLKALIEFFKTFILGGSGEPPGSVTRLLSDNSGNLSSMRICMLLIILSDCFNRTLMAFKGTYVPFNYADAVTFFGIFYAKQLQKGKEIEGEATVMQMKAKMIP